jgi:signal transduction histidine kinase
VTSKLTIRSKLAAALAVPLLALSALVAVQVRESVGNTDAARVQADLATSATGPGGIVTAMQNERNFEALRSIGFTSAVDLPVKTPEEARSQTDGALDTFRNRLDDLDPKAADAYLPAVSAIEGGIDDLRTTADTLAQTPSLEQAQAASDLFGNYTTLLGQLLDANQKVANTIDDAQLRSGVELLSALSLQAEIEARAVREALVAGVLQDPSAAVQTGMLAGQRDANERIVRNLAEDAYQKPVLAVLNHPDRQPYVAAIDNAAVNPLATNINEMLGATPKGDAAQLKTAQDSVAKIVDARAELLRKDATTQQRNYLLAAAGAVVLALMVLALANRWITRPLSRLADEARVMASERLPNAVNSILETPAGEDVVPPAIEPVHVRGGSEVSGAVDALNAVQESAIGLAVEQVVLRRNIADSFVNLGRRNQNLLSRQLDLITQLEQEESDAEELEQLFRLDHLATRMRRNAESLLVLAGEEPARQWSAPVAVGDVLRAALGEVEQYSRVRLQPMDETTVIGKAVADVSHIVAELVENGLTFSPPDATVNVYGRHSDEGYEIAIVDSGLGMSEEDIARANLRLSANESFTVAPSRYLGHYVVAQLALRHQIHVDLEPAEGGGVMATIVLPFTLLDDGMGGPISEVPDVEAFSFGDIAVVDDLEDSTAPIGDAEPIVSGAPADDDEIDVPAFMAAASVLVQPDEATTDAPADESTSDAIEPEPAPTWNAAPAPAEPRAAMPTPVDVGPAPMPLAAATAAFLGATAPVGDAAAPRLPVIEPVPAARVDAVEPAAFVEPVNDEVPVFAEVVDDGVAEAPAAVVDKGAFAAMLHATQASAPIESKEKPEPDPLVEPVGPQPEPVQAFVQNTPELATEVAATEAVAFVAAPIQDDLLPRLPRRGRRGRGADAPAPSVPDQVLRIAAAQTDVEPEPEPAVARVAEAEMVAAVPASAPPLPRRELDAEPVAPAPRAEPAPVPAAAEATRPNYELFAAFRAATDQGRADAVRRGDGGGA